MIAGPARWIALAGPGRYIFEEKRATPEITLPESRSICSTVTALLIVGGLVLPPVAASAQGLAGAYLAARHAEMRNDFPAASDYLGRILQSDPDNPPTLESAAIWSFSAGAFETAAEHAARLSTLNPSNTAAALILTTEAFAAQDYGTALDVLSSGARLHPLIDDLALAWAHLGQGSMSEALDALDSAAGNDGVQALALYCRALALALVGDVEGALTIFEGERGPVADSLNRRGYIAFAQVLGLAERYDDALALLDAVFTPSAGPQIAAMRAAYGQGNAYPFDLVSTPAQGMAEVLSVMSTAMRSAPNPRDALIFALAATRVNPALSDVQLMVGQLYEELGQPRLAAQAYDRIPPGDAFGLAAQVGRAQVLDSMEQRDEAIGVLNAAVAENPQSVSALQVLGDYLRRDGQHEAAIEAYSTAARLLDEQGEAAGWQLWFSRAVSFERTGQWDRAEADFRAALDIDPDQPTVLNYLGYSLVERGEKLDEALDMIERAVAGEPDSGFIVDSLAWALYRLGRHDEAVPHMERALELEPTDPILNDHLGDVYWAVGRHREARFQWRRALSFGPSDDLDEDRIRRKLEVGLDAVLVDEGAPPLHADE